MNLTTRSYQKELLDGDHIPFADIRRNMQELNTINTLLGGHAITLKGFETLLGDRNEITICEIGCGGGDNLAAIVNWCKKYGVTVNCIGIDMKAECIIVAEELAILKGITEWIVSDYAKVVFDHKPDIIFSSLFCHHFTNEELIAQLQWMQANSRTGFFINDLHRNWLAYQSISLLTKLFSASYLVKNDAPISVTRGFLKTEWEILCKQAGIKHCSVSWQWAFRHLIISKHGE
jgi:2-polyprenyl-3-methyl-5-hydroxy-6-metoxy-1,4-benzoquinol methylase